MKELFPATGNGHGGPAITSLQLYLNPDACRMDLAAVGKLHRWNDLKVLDISRVEFRGSPVWIYFNYDQITDPSGVVGDNAEASAEKGEVEFDKMVDDSEAFVEWMKGISWKGQTGQRVAT